MSQKSYEELTKECNALIPRDVIEQREGGFGKKLSYLPGFYVINRLNSVFGQGNWAYQSETTLLHSGVVETSKGPTNSVHYSARVRLVVTVGDKPTEFTDYGYGDGTDKINPGKAHELAIKEAITDGLKRAARCLGNSFGNGLYDKSGEGVEEEVKQASLKPPVAAALPNGVPATPRATVNKLISQTSKVILDRKLRTMDELQALVEASGAKAKEQLTDEQANNLLANLRKVLV